jgi:hypothetical protein
MHNDLLQLDSTDVSPPVDFAVLKRLVSATVREILFFRSGEAEPRFWASKLIVSGANSPVDIVG